MNLVMILLLLKAEEKLVPSGNIPIICGAPYIRCGCENRAEICPIQEI
jgi:hypothetical protein